MEKWKELTELSKKIVRKVKKGVELGALQAPGAKELGQTMSK